MPRVRTSAGSWRIAAAIATALSAAPVAAAPSGAARGEAPSAGGGERAGDAEAEARRRVEINALERQDIAEALRRHFGVTVDWRITPLESLIDMRARAAKAAELQERLNVTVDWQRYSWIELEALRRTLMSFEHRTDARGAADAAAPMSTSAPLPPPGTDGLVQPTFKPRPAARPGRGADPDGVLMPTFGRPPPRIDARDPDGIMRPTFAARPPATAAPGDPDGLLTPTFVPWRRPIATGEGDDLIDPTR